jgi:thermostable 8-oxoguanine DNA glycosylase
MPLERPGKPGGTEIKWTHQLLVYADDVNLLGDNIDTKEKQSLIDTSKEVGIEFNTVKTKYMREKRNAYRILVGKQKERDS